MPLMFLKEKEKFNRIGLDWTADMMMLMMSGNGMGEVWTWPGLSHLSFLLWQCHSSRTSTNIARELQQKRMR